MILNIMIHFNTKIKCFTQPFFTDIEPEKVAVQESRSLQICEDGKQILPYKFLKLYYLGQFNDATGEIIIEEKKELLDCSSLVKKRLNELGWTVKKNKDGVPLDA